MHTVRLEDLAVGDRLGPFVQEVSAGANERYWRGAGIDHPARAEGLLYPPLAANLTILLLQTVVTEPVLHTRQRLECHASSPAGVELTVTGEVVERFVRRDREYAVVEAAVALPDGGRLWTSLATFTPVAA